MADLANLIASMRPEEREALARRLQGMPITAAAASMQPQMAAQPSIGQDVADWYARGGIAGSMGMQPVGEQIVASHQAAQEALARGDRNAYIEAAFANPLASMLDPGTLGGFGAMVKAYHGSPHRFAPQPDAPHGRFDLGKIGTGEGAQAYGHGLYFAENPGVAGSYKTAGRGAFGGTNPVPFLDGKPINWSEIGDDASIAIQSIDDPLVGATVPEKVASLRKHGMAGAANWLEANHARVEMNSGALYNVSLDIEPEDLLDWDAPLSQQSEKVRKALNDLLSKRVKVTAEPIEQGLVDLMVNGKSIGVYTPDKVESVKANLADHLPFTGQQAYKYLSHLEDQASTAQRYVGDEAASRALAKAGIPGLRYFDAGSRQGGEGTRNVVIFDDKLITIESVE